MTPQEQAEAIIGRPIEITPTTDRKFVAVYFDYMNKAPPVMDTEQEARDAFIDQILARKKEIGDEAGDRSQRGSSEEDQGS